MSLTREQVLFADLAKAMKKTVARQANGKSFRCQETSTASMLTRALVTESDSDSEIQQTTNRGNKLKKRARFVRQGKLGPPTGPAVYKEARSNPSARASETTYQDSMLIDNIYRRLNMQDTSEP